MKKTIQLVGVISALFLQPAVFAQDPQAEKKEEPAKQEPAKAAEPKAEEKKAEPAEKKSETKKEKKPKKEKKEKAMTKDVTELKKEDLKVGTGAEAKAGQSVKVHYTGWLTNGTKFDSSVDRGDPFTFHLGAGEVIKGWDEGVAGMKVGGKRKLTIPPTMGYGARGAGNVIPPNATLVFDVELLGVN